MEMLLVFAIISGSAVSVYVFGTRDVNMSTPASSLVCVCRGK